MSFEDGDGAFEDGQKMTVAGVISAVKTRATRNNSLMSYISLEDSTGTIELVAFQRVLDRDGGYIREGTPIIANGRLTLRDDRDPQITLDGLRPLTDFDPMPGEERQKPSKLYVRMADENDPVFERLKLILIMFPGRDQLIVYFSDSKKRVATRCLIHEALIEELREMLGDENVVLK